MSLYMSSQMVNNWIQMDSPLIKTVWGNERGYHVLHYYKAGFQMNFGDIMLRKALANSQWSGEL